MVPNAKDPAATAKQLKVPYSQWLKNMVDRGVYNAAMAALDYRTGQVLAYVGSADYYATKSSKKFEPQFDVMADGWRQPGSAWKPINYITGLEDHTLTAASLFMDVVTDFGGGYTPTDADRLERGPLRLRQAIQVSLNIPAIKAAAINGIDHVIQTAKKFGIRFQVERPDTGVSIGIGTAEVHMIDLVSAYGAIANSGVLMPRTTILKVVDADGNQIYPVSPGAAAGKRVASTQASYIMTNILASNTDPAQNPFWSARAITDKDGTRRPAALKTGTTDDTIDLTAMGFLAPPASADEPAIVAGAWMGNSDNSAPPNGVVALESSASLWQAFLNEATKSEPIQDFSRPDGIAEVAIDAFSGMLPGPFTTKTVTEVFIDGTQPTQVDDTKVPLDIDAATGKLWLDGCVGPKETEGFLDLSRVEAGFPDWQAFDAEWIARARKGPGIRGGPEKTATSYFYQTGGWMPFGATWGAPFAPTETCEPVPTAEPTLPCDPLSGPCPTPPGEGTALVMPNLQCSTMQTVGATLAALGLGFGVVAPSDAGPDWVVAGQNPPPNTVVFTGSMVDLILDQRANVPGCG